ncbi:MAG TPA: hypothetical protein VF585_04035 [Chthoniobacterales bacterium]
MTFPNVARWAACFLAGVGVGWILPKASPPSTAALPPQSAVSKTSLGTAASPQALTTSRVLAGDEPAAPTDPKSWNEQYDQLKSLREKQDFLANLLETEGKRPEAILDFLAKLPRNRLRDEAMQNALQLLGETNPVLAIKRIPELLSSVDAHNAYVGIGEIWGKKDPAAALSWASSQPPSEFASGMMEQIVSSGTTVDPQKMTTLLAGATFPKPEDRELAYRALAGVWAQTDPAGAVAWARQMANQTNLPAPVSSAYLNWATVDPAAAAAAVRNEKPEVLNQVLPELAHIYAENAPEEAARWASGLAPGPAQTEVARSVASAWAQSDAPTAMKWAMSQQGDLRQASLQAVSLQWTRANPEAFEKFAAQQSPESQTELQGILDNMRRPKQDKPRTRRPILSTP